MPICHSCDKKWTYKQTIITLFRLKCPHCEKRQYESASSRLRSGTLTLLALVVILPVNALFDFSVGTALIIGIFIVLIIFGIYPFILKLSSKEEPYW
ncbi:TIGR04104 family putative zinc finger protein [Paucisalibacillus sp. EB02]|uniref:TIGR04104 family putative zinc finger protein n=1 Tax=Paucisalibacillus sp. EB02 TaxID=1347087 RepID=UPI0005AA3626|nr:TIGR04104 family putative zinc finger protein [Paucisalibacillus sp. EB02]